MADELVPIPGLKPTDVAVVSSLLKGAGFFHRGHQPIGWGGPAALFVRASDVEDVKAFLSDYRISDDRGSTFPIPW